MGKTLQKYRKLFEAVRKGTIHRLYFLYGPEEYLKKEFIQDLLNAALPESNRAFNLDVIYGDEFDKPLFDDRVGSFPLFTERRVVILRNFKALSTPHKDHVISRAGEIPDSLVLVVEDPTDKLDTVRLKNMKKAADETGLSFKFDFLDRDETVERVTGRFKREGYDIQPAALDLLVDSVGTQLIDLINEVEKICLAAGERKTVDEDLVSAVVGKYRTEDLFSLLDVLELRDPAAVVRKVDRLIDGGEEPVVMLGMLLKRLILLLEVKAIESEHRGKGREAMSGKALAASMAGNISPFYAEILRRQAVRFEDAGLRTLLANLRWAEFKLKTSQLGAKHLIEEALLASHLGKTLALTGDSL